MTKANFIGIKVVFATSAVDLYVYASPFAVKVGDYVIAEDKRHNHMELGIAKVVDTFTEMQNPKLPSFVQILSVVDDNGFLAKRNQLWELAALEQQAKKLAQKLRSQQVDYDVLSQDVEGRNLLIQIDNIRRQL